MTSAASSAFPAGRGAAAATCGPPARCPDRLREHGVEICGPRGLVEHVLLEARPLGEDRGARIFGALRGAKLEEPAQLVAPIFAAQELVERGDRLFVAGLFLDERVVFADRVVDAAELGRMQARQLGLQGAAILGGDALLLLQAGGDRVDVELPALGGARRLFELVEALLGGSELVSLEGPLHRGRPLTELLAGDVDEAVQELELLVVFFCAA